MNIVMNTENNTLLNEFIRVCKDKGSDKVLIAKQEDVLFKTIEEGEADAYVLSDSAYAPKAMDFIKKSCPYVPIILLGTWVNDHLTTKADIVMGYHESIPIPEFANYIKLNIRSYVKNFTVLKKLTTKMADVIEFGNCSYDPTRRLLFVDGKEIKKFSPKEGGVLEVLALNFEQIVKGEIIMEKVWRKSDYFTSRCLDVYTTHVRKSLKTAGVKMEIKKISNIGLVLEPVAESSKKKQKQNKTK